MRGTSGPVRGAIVAGGVWNRFSCAKSSDGFGAPGWIA